MYVCMYVCCIACDIYVVDIFLMYIIAILVFFPFPSLSLLPCLPSAFAFYLLGYCHMLEIVLQNFRF